MDDSIYYKIVEKSSLIFKIKDIASEIYNLWVVNTKPQYPNYPFKADSKTLVADLKIALARSLESLWAEDNEDERQMLGWPQGFIFGYVSSNLSTQWSYQYVYIETDEYKNLLACSSSGSCIDLL